MIRIDDLLREAEQAAASDVHITTNRLAYFRVDGELHSVGDQPMQTQEVADVVQTLLKGKERATKLLADHYQSDFSYVLPGGSRFRVNVFKRKGELAVALRLIPTKIRTVEELNLPAQVVQFAELKQGFVLVVGPAGHGKSSTLAALIDHINHTRQEHIITIEDPIEYDFKEEKSIIDQREVGQDAVDFASAVRATLRQDPNVIMIGELRDLETMQTAITIAETGHLVFGTLHTNDAAQTVERLIDSFPPSQQRQVRSQLAVALSGVISQRLMPRLQGGRIPATEIMITTPAVRNVIREGNVHHIPGIIQTNAAAGMQTLDSSLQGLIDGKAIDPKAARPYLSSSELPR